MQFFGKPNLDRSIWLQIPDSELQQPFGQWEDRKRLLRTKSQRLPMTSKEIQKALKEDETYFGWL